MRLTKSILIVLAAVFFSLGNADVSLGNADAVQNMTIVGQIAFSRNDYIIRGEKPREVFNILNGDPSTLARLAALNQTVTLEVRIVHGDNVEIETINGQPFNGQPY